MFIRWSVCVNKPCIYLGVTRIRFLCRQRVVPVAISEASSSWVAFKSLLAKPAVFNECVCMCVCVWLAVCFYCCIWFGCLLQRVVGHCSDSLQNPFLFIATQKLAPKSLALFFVLQPVYCNWCTATYISGNQVLCFAILVQRSGEVEFTARLMYAWDCCKLQNCDVSRYGMRKVNVKMNAWPQVIVFYYINICTI